LACLPLAVLLFGLLYMLGMSLLEGEPRSLGFSLEWAAETLTTTGYGGDSQWHHPLMSLFVIITQFVGLFLVFMIFPVYVLPYFEERFESRLPRRLPDVSDRVVIYRYGAAVDSLMMELSRFGCRPLIIEGDEAVARTLFERGESVVVAQLDGGDLDFTAIKSARSIVANGEDHDNAVLITMARTQGYAGPIYALAEDPLHRPAMLRAGASEALTPRLELATTLAGKASSRIRQQISGMHQIGEHVGISELRIHANSPLAGCTLGEARIRERIGATVIAQWIGGHFVVGGHHDTRIRPGAILVAIGSHAALERLAALARSGQGVGPIIVAGFGEVGQRVTALLRAAGDEVRVINDHPDESVDVVGNIMHDTTLERADLGCARAVVLTLGNDSETLFAAAVIREYALEVPLYARVNLPKSVDLLYRLGADFVLSVSEVAGEMLAHKLIGEEYVTVEPQLKIIRVRPDAFIGLHPWQAGIREQSSCHLVAVERGNEVHVEFSADFHLEADDGLYLCGTPDALDNFFQLFPDSSPV